MKYRKLLALSLVTALVLSGCGNGAGSNVGVEVPVGNSAGNEASGQNSGSVAEVLADLGMLNADEIFSDRDFETDYDESKSVVITLSGSSAQCSSDAVEISGSTITIKDEGTYILSGSLDDGMIVVNADKDDKTQLVLNGVSIHSKTSAPIYIKQADKVFVTLAAGSENSLSNGGSFDAIDENAIDAVIFSKEDLTLNGEGALAVSSPAGHGIVSKDELAVTGGNYEISCASHGISGKDGVGIADGVFDIVAGKDGVHAENNDDSTLGYVYIQDGTFKIASTGDGVSAESTLQIDGGTFDIVAGGGIGNAAEQTSGWGEFGGMGGHGNMGGFGNMGGSGNMGGMGNSGRGTGGEKLEKPTDMPAEVPTDMPEGMPEGMPEMPEGMPEGMPEMPEGFTSPGGGEGFAAFPQNSNQEIKTEQSTGEDTTVSGKGLKATGLIVNGGTFNIDAADDGVHANGSIAVNGGVFAIATGDDGFHADETLAIAGGTIDISTSYEGLEGLHVVVSGGEISLVASDDGLNAAGGMDSSGFGGMGGGNDTFGGRGGKRGGMQDNAQGGMSGGSSNGSVTISGGNIYVKASGDGIDANGTLSITGGNTVICGPNQGDTATLDYDTTATITGGTFVGTGAMSMAQTFSDSQQGVLAVNVGTVAAKTEVTVTDKAGNVKMTVTPELDFSLVIFSSNEIISGETYVLTVGSESAEFTAQ